MLIWFLMVIPIVAVLILSIFFQKKIAWWEYLLVFGVPIIIIFVAKQSSIHYQTQDTEYWNSYLVRAEYYEEWSTWDHEICTKTVCTGSGKNQICHAETYDCSHCDETQPRWVAYDNLGKSYHISSYYFEQLCKLWGKREKVELNRRIEYHRGLFSSCGQDGDKFVTTYDNIFEHTVPVCKIYTYENKVQCSRSVFNFREVHPTDVKKFGLVDYLTGFDEFSYNPIYGDNNQTAIKRLSQWNALLGSYKKVHMNIIVFRNQPIIASEMQKAYWKGGNKNEFILCIGLNGENKIQWTKVISWCEIESLKLQVERIVASMDYNLPAIVDTMANYVKKDFKKKSFDDFNYLSVEPTTNAIIISFIIILLFTIGLCVFVIKNNFDLEG